MSTPSTGYQQSTPPNSPPRTHNVHSHIAPDALEPEWTNPEPTEWRSGHLEDNYPLLNRVNKVLEEYYHPYQIPRTKGLELAQHNKEEQRHLLIEFSARNNLDSLDKLPQAYPTPPVSTAVPYCVYIPEMATTTTVSDNAYKFPNLKGRENYTVWQIQMQDIFVEIKSWEIVDSTTVRPSTGTTTPGGSSLGAAAVTAAQQNWD
ncbi:type VI Secretion system protein ImpL [Rhizoctonia solani]|uniref:Type VI Secretion system protein ImpL n=1 Tax=Rhizoctonia solani TaxID=456999 RepID=A0A8H8SZI8_9AGAM|nr:type VI Secretion system protein ImpL [Rhizoctonia solani]QRW24371.1 type VI Secretion system protein ImpL [Rhizoctonia solani]